ncbi:MAG: aminopeptidase [Christensenellales bacterium]
MFDERLKQLAKNLVNYSCDIQPGENVLIEVTGDHPEVLSLLIREVYLAKGVPFLKLHNQQAEREWLMGATEAQLQKTAEVDVKLMDQMQAYIGLRGGENSSENSDVPSEKMSLYHRIYWEPVHGSIRVKNTKWVVLRYPTPSMAQAAGMSTRAFEDYYFNVCNLDYSRMDKAMDPLKELMEKTDRVRITGPNTDLSFSIKGIPAIKCSGKLNIPDGEIFTAPIKDSVNGYIAYNTPSLEEGFTFEQIYFRFENGRIVEAHSNNDARINQLLDTDKGARYVGEFAIVVNPYITSAMKDTLFDEKISGSFHFTPGRCYDEAPNGNESAVHWDLVMIQTKEYGGGEMYFDDVLIRKDGVFVVDSLKGLNPDALK